MLRTMLASLTIALVCSANLFAGDCGCGARHGRPLGMNSGRYGGSCGAACGDSCGDPCSDPCASCSCHGRGCGKCCFPILRGAAKAVGTVINLLIPRPCCRSGCNSGGSSCGDTACNDSWDPTNCSSCGEGSMNHSHMPSHVPSQPANPFIDDQPMPTPTPMPSKEARSNKQWKTPVATRSPSYTNPRTTSQTVVQKNARPQPAVRVTGKPVHVTQTANRNVIKLSHDEQVEEQIEEELTARMADEEFDSAPIAPSSVRLVGHEDRPEPMLAPVTNTVPTKTRPTNPLR